MSSAAHAAIHPQTRLVELLEQVDYRLAETDADREAIYRLRYRAYLQEGAIAPNHELKVYDPLDDAPNTWIFGIYLEGVLASSIRVSVASPEYPMSPSVNVFPDILEPELALGKVIVDPTRFVADPDRAKRIPELPYLTVRLGYVACGYFHANLGLATVRAEHQAFYRRVFLQKALAPPRPFPGLIKPVCLMAAHYPTVREKIFHRYPYFRSTDFERKMLFGRAGSAESSQPEAVRPSAASELLTSLQPHQG